MFSPMMTVVVLAVLWLIVVIPMLVKRKDDRAGERSAARFGSAMRALSSRRSLVTLTRSVAPADLERRTAPRGQPRPDLRAGPPDGWIAVRSRPPWRPPCTPTVSPRRTCPRPVAR